MSRNNGENFYQYFENTRKILAACAKNDWKISENQFKHIFANNYKVSKEASDEEKKLYCRLLYAGRIHTQRESNIFINIESHFRQQCGKLLREENSYIYLSLGFELGTELEELSTQRMRLSVR